MKKKLYVLLAMCIGFGLTQDLYSQEKPIRVGVLGGVNLSSLNMYVVINQLGGIKTEARNETRLKGGRRVRVLAQ